MSSICKFFRTLSCMRADEVDNPEEKTFYPAVCETYHVVCEIPPAVDETHVNGNPSAVDGTPKKERTLGGKIKDTYRWYTNPKVSFCEKIIVSPVAAYLGAWVIIIYATGFAIGAVFVPAIIALYVYWNIIYISIKLVFLLPYRCFWQRVHPWKAIKEVFRFSDNWL